MASSQTLGQILGRRVAHYRERAGLSQPQLAQRLADLGFDIGRVTIANIEAAGREGSTAKNRTRADNATIVDVLALARALDVPPPLLFIPLGETEEVEFGNVTMHPAAMLRWVAGDEPPARLTTDSSEHGSIAMGRAQWFENARPIQLFRELHEIHDRVQDAATHKAMVAKNAAATDDDRATAQRLLDRCLRDFDRHHRYMISAGLSVPEVPDEWAERMMLLRVPEDDR